MTPIRCERELLQRRADVAESVRQRLDAAWFDFGDNERLRMVFDIDMHLAFLGEALQWKAPRLFVEYAAWTWQLLRTSGGDTERFDRCLEAIDAQLLDCGAGEWVHEARLILADARAKMRVVPPPGESHLRAGNRHKALAEAFLTACLELRRADALSMIQQASQLAVPVREIYLDVIAPVMHELGRLWHLNQITVGKEHYCTAVAQMAMANLFPSIFEDSRKVVGRLVSACVAGELHEIGARMVADLFEMHGWETVFLGADVPKDSVVDMLIEVDAQVLAISVTLAANLSFVSDLIAAVRATASCRGVKIMVGGGAFNVEPELWRKLGADGWASDAQGALDLAAGWRA